MRISDWGADVGSADLGAARRPARPATPGPRRGAAAKCPRSGSCPRPPGIITTLARRDHLGPHRPEFGKEAEAQRLDEIIDPRSEEHTSELQSLMRISYAVFCLKKKNY